MSTNTFTKSVLKDMRPALMRAHNTNNGKAISKDFAFGCGVSERAYTSWCTWINSLHYAVTPWVEKFNDKDISDEELKAIYDKVFPILKQLAKVDDTPLFLRDSDAVRICGFAAKHGKTANGSVDVLVGAVAFRREVETMLGIRLAQNEVLVEDDYDIIMKYEKAEKNKEKAEDRINGYIDAKGQAVKGLKTTLEEAKATLEEMKKLAIEMGADKKTIDDNKIISGYVANVTEIESAIKSAEGQIAKNKETIKKFGKQYKAIMAKIAEVK